MFIVASKVSHRFLGNLYLVSAKGHFIPLIPTKSYHIYSIQFLQIPLPWHGLTPGKVTFTLPRKLP